MRSSEGEIDQPDHPQPQHVSMDCPPPQTPPHIFTNV